MPDCFVIMPIETHPDEVETYSDPDHFKHVLEHLFKPAIETAFTMIPPSAKGADLIHAEIVKHLETAELVLCDMSTLNPNVFFEFGVRTALNKPVCLVKDTLTPNVPFDTGIINYHTYDPSLTPWTLKAEIEKLSKHLTESRDSCRGENPLWKYFGLTQRGEPAMSQDPLQDKLDLILRQLTEREPTERFEAFVLSQTPMPIIPRIKAIAGPFADRIDVTVTKKPRIIEVSTNVSLPHFIRRVISSYYAHKGYRVVFSISSSSTAVSSLARVPSSSSFSSPSSASDGSSAIPKHSDDS